MSAPYETAGALDRIAERLDELGLRPLVDREMETVVPDCPEWRAGDTDPCGSGVRQWWSTAVQRSDSTVPRAVRR